MKTRVFRRVLVLSLALAVVGCGDPDPSQENNDDNNNNGSTNTNTNTNTGTNTNTNTTPPPNNVAEGCSTDAECAAEQEFAVCEGGACVDTCINSGQCGEAGQDCVPRPSGGDGFICGDAPQALMGTCDFSETDFVGQTSAEFDEAHGSMSALDAALVPAQGGLAAVLAEIAKLEASDDSAVNSATFDEGALQVSEALVVATQNKPADESKPDYGNMRFWIEDADTGLHVRLAQGLVDSDGNPVQVRVGQKLAFDVRKVTNYLGTPQISEVSAVEVLSEDNALPLRVKDGEALAAEDYLRLVKVQGQVTGLSNAICGGGNICWELTHDGQTSVLRTSSNFVELGKCISYLGPVSAFPAPVNNAGADITYQYDAANWAWHLTFAPVLQ